MKWNDIRRWKKNEAMHGVEQWKSHLGVKCSRGTVRKESNRDSESSGE